MRYIVVKNQGISSKVVCAVFEEDEIHNNNNFNNNISSEKTARSCEPFHANCIYPCNEYKGPSIVVPNRMQIALIQNVNKLKEVNFE